MTARSGTRWNASRTPVYRSVLDAEDLLQAADRFLLASQPAFFVEFGAPDGGYLARWDYPGRVSVFDRMSGELLAVSRPGQPTKPAATPKPRQVAKPQPAAR